MKRILAALMILVIITALLPAGAGMAETASRTIRLAIMTDLHYASLYNPAAPGDALYNASQSELRLMHENDMILDAALREAARLNPDALLISGDMSSNGELDGVETLARKLRNLKTQEGFRNTGIYVVNGNHDMNNSYAADFTSGSVQAASRIQPEDFRRTFSDGLGYGENDHWTGGSRSDYKPAEDDPYAMRHHGSLSYAADIADGVTLVVLDTTIYRSENGAPDHYYNEAQQTPGYVSDDLLQWAVDQTLAAQARNNLVLVMAHHALLPHYSTSEEKAAWFMDNVRIPNWEHVTNTLADAGAVAVLTGHSHVNDISMHVTPNNNVFYDIETASISAYPCSWRSLEIRIDGEGDKKSYAFSVQTHDVQAEDLQGDTDTWYYIDANGDRQSFVSSYGSNLQEYAYARTSMTRPFIAPGIDYNVKSILYDIFHAEGGLAAYLRQKLELKDGESAGSWVQETMRNMIDRLDGLEKDISIQGFSVSLKMEKTGGTLYQPQFKVTLSAMGLEEQTAVMTIDLRRVNSAVDKLIDNAQAESEQGDWTTNPYGTSQLTEDITRLLADILTIPLTTPLENNLTALEIYNSAYQGCAYGDEANEKSRYDSEREALHGDKLREELVKQAWAVLLTLDDDEGGSKKYPAISRLLQEQIAEDSLVQLKDCHGFLLDVFKTFLELSPLKYLNSLLSIAKTVGPGMNPVPASAADLLTGKVADLHETMSLDTNVPQDREWTFRSVLFDANGGTVSRSHGVTDGNHKLPGLPIPERSGYTFEGWFDAPEGGKQITTEDDMSGTGILYAHWTEKPVIEVSVTFRVLNGLWNDGTSAEKTVTLTGHTGDALKLAADDIPAVGAMPAEDYREGNWDVVPDTKNVLTSDTTYTYTYAAQEIRYTVVSVVNREHVVGSGKDTVITAKRNINDQRTFSLYTHPAMDGDALPEGASSAVPGSLVLTLNAAYLDTLEEGTHQVGIFFSDGKAETGITVVNAPEPTPTAPEPAPTAPEPAPTAPEPAPTPKPTPTPKPVPKTGDNEPIALWFALVFLGVLGLGSLGIVKRRK